MTTLNASHKATVGVPALSVLTITASGTGSAVRLSDMPGSDPSSPIAIASGDLKQLGPHATSSRYRLECNVGSFDYAVEAADFPATTSDVERIVRITQAAYDDLSAPDAATLYLVIG